MFVGIIAMISSVLVGTLGKEYLISVNAQMYGWSPTYSFSITGSDFQDTIKMENFFREIYNTDHFVAVTFSMLEEITVAPVASVSSLQDISDTVYKKTVPVDVVFTTSTYNKIYNLPMSSGDWFDSSEINKTLCMVVNKAAQNYFDTSYAVGNVESSLSLTPFNVVGTVNDGTDIPTVYLDAHSIELLVPNMWKVKNATVHWHSEAGITMRQMYSSLHDILEDTIGGNLDIIGKSDIGDTYNSVLSVLQLGLLVTSFLLLFVSVLGQINIGLSSLEQRTHELLIRRAIGASRANIVTLVLGAQLTISVFVCIVSILISFFLVQGMGLFLPVDSPVAALEYPILSAVVAVITSVVVAKLFVIEYAATLADLDSIVPANYEAIQLTKPGSSVANIDAKKYFLHNLFAAMLVPSGNDAAYVVADYCGSILSPQAKNSQERINVFMEHLNNYLQNQGYENTILYDPSGYDVNALTTVSDLKSVSTHLLEKQWFRDIVSKSNYTATLPDGSTQTWRNTNTFLDQTSEYYNENVKGIKTGSLSNDYNLVVLYQQHGKEFLICSLGSQSDSSRYDDVNYILKTIDESDYLTK